MLKTTMTFVIHHSKPIPEMADLFANRISTHSSVEHVEVQEASGATQPSRTIEQMVWEVAAAELHPKELLAALATQPSDDSELRALLLQLCEETAVNTEAYRRARELLAAESKA